MSSYYNFFCQTNTKVAITAFSAVATVAYIGLTLWSFNQWSQDQDNLKLSCGPQNKTTDTTTGRGLFARTGGSYVKEESCDDVYTGDCIDLCDTASSSFAAAFLLLELGVFGLLGTIGLWKAKQMVTKAIELPAWDDKASVAILDANVKQYGATQTEDVDSDDDEPEVASSFC